jgi:hypothetical protein
MLKQIFGVNLQVVMIVIYCKNNIFKTPEKYTNIFYTIRSFEKSINTIKNHLKN